jgi:hypothetical protein
MGTRSKHTLLGMEIAGRRNGMDISVGDAVGRYVVSQSNVEHSSAITLLRVFLSHLCTINRLMSHDARASSIGMGVFSKLYDLTWVTDQM